MATMGLTDMVWLVYILQAVFIANVLGSFGLSAYILSKYAKRAISGNQEARWLGRHITAIAVSHLMLLAWITARFVVAWQRWSWGWVLWLIAIFALSDFGLLQLYLFRRWKDAKHAHEHANELGGG